MATQIDDDEDVLDGIDWAEIDAQTAGVFQSASATTTAPPDAPPPHTLANPASGQPAPMGNAPAPNQHVQTSNAHTAASAVGGRAPGSSTSSAQHANQQQQLHNHGFPPSQTMPARSTAPAGPPSQNTAIYNAQPPMQLVQHQHPASQVSAHHRPQQAPRNSALARGTHLAHGHNSSTSIQPSSHHPHLGSFGGATSQQQPHQRLPVPQPQWQLRNQQPASSGQAPAPAGASNDAQAPQAMATLREQLSRTAAENLQLQEQVRKTPAAQVVLQENAALRLAVQELQEQARFRDTEVAQQQARVREQAGDLARDRSELQRLQQEHTRLELALADASAAAAAAAAAGAGARPPAAAAAGAAPPGRGAARRRSGGEGHTPPQRRGGGAAAAAVPAVAASRSPDGRAVLAAPAAVPARLQSQRPHANACLATLCQPQMTGFALGPSRSSPVAAQLLHMSSQPPSGAPAMQRVAAASITTLTTPAAAEAFPGIQAPLRAVLSGHDHMHALESALVDAMPSAVAAARTAAAERRKANAAPGAQRAQHRDDAVPRLSALLTVLGAAASCDCALGRDAVRGDDGNAGEQLMFGRKRAVAASGENCGRGGNGAAGDAGAAGGAGGGTVGGSGKPLGVSAAAAVEWLEGHLEGGGGAALHRGAARWLEAHLEGESVTQQRLHWVEGAVVCICDALEMCMSERHTLELRFAALQCSLSLAHALSFAELPRLLPLLRSSAFALALEPPSTTSIRMHCVDAGVKPPPPEPGFQLSARLLPPSIPAVHALILKAHTAHALACHVWACCSQSRVVLSELDAPREVPGAAGDAPAAGGAGVPCWSAILHYARFALTTSTACVDAALAHAAHLEATQAPADSVCGAAGVAPTDADRVTVRHAEASDAGPFAAARAAMQALGHLVAAGRLDMVETALVVEAPQRSRRSARGFTQDVVYALLQVAHSAAGSMQDAMQREVGLYEASQELRSGGKRTAAQEVELRLCGTDARRKALAPLNELHWSHPDRRGGGAAAAAVAAAAAQPPTPAAAALHAAVWQRVAAAHEALLLLRRLAMLKGSAAARESSVGEFVLSVLMRRPEALLLLEAAVQRIAVLQHESPFAYRDPPPGHAAAAPPVPPWARELLCRHDRSVRSGRASGDGFRRYAVSHAIKAAHYWRKQAAHNSGDAAKGGQKGGGR
eukprot:jgi/Ulvmu1/12358/UM009_0004.1